MSIERLPRWDEYRPECLKIAFCIALACANLVINITTEIGDEDPYVYQTVEEDPWEQIPPTAHPKKPLPKPPKIEISKEIILDEPDIIDDMEEPEKDVAVDTKITKTVTEDPSNNTESIKESAPKVELIIEDDDSEELVLFAENMPIFGECKTSISDEGELRICSNKELMTFIYGNLKYPRMARESDIEGSVIVEFVVNKEGEVVTPKILRGLGGGCSEAVLNVVKKMPNWKPGKQNGRPVNVVYRMPVKFRLN